MDPIKMRCQSITKTTGKPHEHVQLYSTQHDAKFKPVDSLVITSEEGSPLLGKFMAGRTYALSLEDLTPKDAPAPTETKEEETVTITADDVTPAS